MRVVLAACLTLSLGALAGAQLVNETPLHASWQWGPSGHVPVVAAWVDFDGDGLLDVVSVYDSPITGQRVLLQSGDGAYGIGWSTSNGVPDVQPSLAFGDVDGDRDLDGFAVTTAGALLYLRGVWFPPSGHTYIQVVTLPLSASMRASVAAGDLTGDGLADALVSRGDDDLVTVVTHDGLGSVMVGPSAAVPGGPGRLALGDLDGDGWLDAAVACADSGALELLRGTGDGLGGLAPLGAYPLGDALGPVALGDWNADGLLDVATAGATAGMDTGVLVLQGQGGGSLGLPQVLTEGGLEAWLSVADLDRDGVDDLVVSRVGGDGVRVALGAPAGPGEVDAFPWYDAPLQPGDLDGDGLLDLLSSRWRGTTQQGVGWPSVHEVLPGVGGGAFARATHHGGGQPDALFVGDLDDDGVLDVLTGEGLAHAAWLGDGAGGFTAGPSGTGRLVGAVLTHLDGDGLLDLVFEQPTPTLTELSARRGDGAGGFATSWTAHVPNGSVRLLVVDADGDGIPDIVRQPVGATVVELYRGQGDGTFGAAIPSDVLVSASDLGAGDFDDDGELDLLLTGDVLTNVDLYTRLGQGGGTFGGGPVQTAGAWQLPELVLHDLDEDGREDAILMPAVPSAGAYNVFGDLAGCRGLPAGAFDAAVELDYAWATSRHLFVDMDGDGDEDHVSATPFATSVGVRRADGTFALAEPEHFGVGALDVDWTPLAAGDVTGDGRPDLVAGTTRGFAVLPQLTPDPWVGHGRVLPGDTEPSLVMGGPLTAGSTLSFSLVGGPPGGSAWLVVGAAAWLVPFKGGWLVPAPQLLQPLPLDGSGGLAFSLPWPPGVPSGTSTWWQCWMPDASGVWGWVASNAVEGVAP